MADVAQHKDAMTAAGALVWFQISQTLKKYTEPLYPEELSNPGGVNLDPVLDFFVGYGWLEQDANGCYRLTTAGREASND